MAFTDTPNKLEAVFVQRKVDNLYYEQINVSGSDLIVYLDSNGVLNADKISVWAANYGLGGSGGSSVSSSWASASISASYAKTASFALNGGTGGGGSGVFASQSMYSTQSIFATSSLSASWASASLRTIQAQFATQSIFATSSLSASWASSSINAIQSQYATQSISATSSLSASWASSSLSSSVTITSSYAVSASNAVTWDSSSILEYVNNLFRSTTLYLTATASNVSGYYEMRPTGSGATVATLTTSSIPNNGYAFSWLSPGLGVGNLQEGLYHSDFVARVTSAGGDTTLTPEIYLTDANGISYYELPSGQVSDLMGTSFVRYQLSIIFDSPVTKSLTDRVSFRLKANTTVASKDFELKVEGDVLSHIDTPISSVTTNVASASYADFALNSLFASNANSASWASSSITSSWTFAALVADFSVDSAYALSASVAVTSLTSDYALESRIAQSSSYAISASYVSGSSAASISLTSSYVSSSGYADIINASYYRLGSKSFGVSSSYLTALTVTLAQNSNAYVKFTYHGVDITYGTAFFMGEYFLQKDSITTISGEQPGEIISHYNSNPTVNIQSYIPDIAYDVGSASLAIQLKATSGSFTGSLVYEIRGMFSDIEQPFVPIVPVSYGDTFENYPLGPISILYDGSTAFSSTPGSVIPTTIGIIAYEGIDSYVSGSAPSLNAGFGWAGAGIIN